MPLLNPMKTVFPHILPSKTQFPESSHLLSSLPCSPICQVVNLSVTTSPPCRILLLPLPSYLLSNFNSKTATLWLCPVFPAHSLISIASFTSPISHTTHARAINSNHALPLTSPLDMLPLCPTFTHRSHSFTFNNNQQPCRSPQLFQHSYPSHPTSLPPVTPITLQPLTIKSVHTYLLNRLQVVQNTAARLLLGIPARNSVRQHLRALHWLPVAERVKFKSLVIAHHALHALGPIYLQKRFFFYTPRRPLRSSSQLLANVPRFCLQRTGAVPLLWNPLWLGTCCS